MSGLEILAVLAPVSTGRVSELNSTLQLIRDDESPFARVEGTHFARLVLLSEDQFVAPARPVGMRRAGRLIDALTHRARPQRPDAPAGPYLFFSAAYDEMALPYAERLRLGLGPAADEVFGHCPGYPGRSSAPDFARFLAERSLPCGYVFPAMDAQPAVATIRTALATRHALIDLALRSPTLAPPTLATELRTLLTPPQATIPSPRPPSPAPPLTPAPAPSPAPAPAPASIPVSAPAPTDAVHATDAVHPAPTPRPSPAPPPSTDWPRTGRRPPHRPDLHDVQGIVTTGYPAHEAARHLFLRVTDPDQARATLSTLATRIPNGVSARAVTIDLAVHLAFTHSGLAALGLSDRHLAAFPDEFREGMAAREDALTPGRGAATYESPFTGAPVDVLVLLSASDTATLDRMTFPYNGFEIAGTVDGERHRVPGGREFTEHFGFVDGVSQPSIRGVTGTGGLPPGEVLLGFADIDGDVAGAGLDPAWARHGSYLVYRRLRQDVPAFRDLVAGLASISGLDPDTSAAKIMGRHRDGRPLGPAEGFQQNDADGHHCPVGSHVRRANPRDSRPVATTGEPTTKPDLEHQLAQRHRMLRRGIPYGPPLPPGETDGADRGLAFIALVGDLRRQFEFVQSNWMADGNSFRLGADRDVISGAAPSPKMTVQGEHPVFLPTPEPVVTCTGGDYFFLPALHTLRALLSEPPT